MSKIRISESRAGKFDCQSLHIEDYNIQEVMIFKGQEEKASKAFSVEVRGENLRAVAQPLIVMVGEQMVKYLQIAPDEKSAEGVLLEEPQDGDMIDIILGDQDHVRHPTALSKSKIKRMKDLEK